MCDTRTWVFNLLIALIIYHVRNFGQCHAVSAVESIDALEFDGEEEEGFNMHGTEIPEAIILESQKSTPNFTYFVENANNYDEENVKETNYDDFSERPSSGGVIDRLASLSAEELNEQEFNNAAAPPPALAEVVVVEGDVLVDGGKKQDDNSGHNNDDEDESVAIVAGETYASSSVGASQRSSSSHDQNEYQEQQKQQHSADKKDQRIQHQQHQQQEKQPAAQDNNHLKRNGMVLKDYSMGYNAIANGSNGSKEAVTNSRKLGLSAFEQHKTHRRNNKRYGQKSQKKKYKDYLRYATDSLVMSERDNNEEKDNAIEATKMSNNTNGSDGDFIRARSQNAIMKKYNRHRVKSVGLPPSPIFSIGPAVSTSRPYYQGLMNYFTETDDDGIDEVSSWTNADPVNAKQSAGTNAGRSSFRSGMKTQASAVSSQYPQNERNHHQHHQHHYNNHHHQQFHRNHHHHQRSRSNPSANRNNFNRRHHHQHQHHHRKMHLPTIANEGDGRTSELSASSRPQQMWPTVRDDNARQGRKHPDNGASRFNQYPASNQLGHQITQMEDFDKYYSKWPHLARLQYQLNEDYTEGGSVTATSMIERDDYRRLNGNDAPPHHDNYDADNTGGVRGNTDGVYNLNADTFDGDVNGEDDGDDNDGDDDDDDDDEDDDDEDANLPPYIKKYNRRNKQLLNLLEGTLPPPTPPPSPRKVHRIWSNSFLQPGPRDSSSYASELKHRNRNSKWRYGDLFEEQRANAGNSEKLFNTSEVNVNDPSLPISNTSDTGISIATIVDTTSTPTNITFNTITTTTTTTKTQSPFDELMSRENDDIMVLEQNHLPGDDISISQELYDWDKEITSYNDEAKIGDIADDEPEHDGSDKIEWQIEKSPATARPTKKSLMGVPRSRSSQLSANGNRRNSFISGTHFKSNPMFSALSSSLSLSSASASLPSSLSFSSSTATTSSRAAVAAPGNSTPKPINSFVYHRVVEAPRIVGAGQTGRKQRLPFVAITDRRLETSKKIRQKDLEQNHFPMP